MPNLGAPELIILAILVVPVIVLIAVLTGVRHGSSHGRSPRTLAAPGWYPDPASRHHFRYWDGINWTASVSDGTVTSTDPL